MLTDVYSPVDRKRRQKNLLVRSFLRRNCALLNKRTENFVSFAENDLFKVGGMEDANQKGDEHGAGGEHGGDEHGQVANLTSGGHIEGPPWKDQR